MRFFHWRVAALLVPLCLTACSTATLSPSPDSTTRSPGGDETSGGAPETFELGETITLSRDSEHVTIRLEADSNELPVGGSTDVRVLLGAPNGVSSLASWIRLHFSSNLTVSPRSSNWDCSPTVITDSAGEIVCTTRAALTAPSLTSAVEFSVRAGRRSGLHGFSVEAGFGSPPSQPGEWATMAARPEAARMMLAVLPPTPRAPSRSKRQRVTTASVETTERSQPTSMDRLPPLRSSHVSPTIAADALSSGASLVAFCALYAALSVTNSSITAGPVTFSALGSSSNSGGGCDGSSTITLQSANVSIGGVTFSNVNGSITPTTITLNSRVDSGRVGLTVTGPFPDTGAVFTATATFALGSTSVTLGGSLDYSTPNTIVVTLGLSSSSLGWSPLPSFSVASGGVTGTFTRRGSGASAVDTFDVRMTFNGNWNPIGTVSVTSVTADVSNTSGDLVVSLGATAAGGVSIAGLSISVAGLSITGSVDTATEVTTLNVSLNALDIDNIVRINPAVVKFSYDPRVGGASGTTVFVTGDAVFAGNLGAFFSGASATATVEFSSDGFIVSAAMNSGPPTPGFNLTSLQFVYASLVNPTVPLNYQPTYPGASGILIPLANKAPLAIATTSGLPASFAKALTSLSINIIDPNALGVIAIQLPPAAATFSIFYAAPSQPFLIGSASDATFVRFDDVYLTIKSDESTSFTIGGDVTMQVSGATLQLRSGLTVEVTATGGSIDGFLELIDTSGWTNAFGISGLTVFDLLVQAGMADGLPSFGIEATASLPPAVTAPLGIVNGSVITFGLNLSATAPCALFSINPPSTNPRANVISLSNGGLTATSATMVIAPEGCQFGTTSYSGFALGFTGAIRGVSVGFNTTFTLDPSFTLQGSGYIGTFPLGSVQMQQTTVNLSISDSGFSLTLEGGFTAGSVLTATGKALLGSNGGFTFDGNGTLAIGATKADVTVHATDCKDAACTSLVAPSFVASGNVTIQQFAFAASVSISSTGVFDAKLTIPGQKTTKGFSSGNISGSFDVTYSISVEVTNKGSDDLKFSGDLKLKSCKYGAIDCSGADVKWSADIRNGQVTLAVDVTYALVVSFKTSITV